MKKRTLLKMIDIYCSTNNLKGYYINNELMNFAEWLYDPANKKLKNSAKYRRKFKNKIYKSWKGKDNDPKEINYLFKTGKYYTEYLESYIWKTIRKRVLKRDQKTCYGCGAKNNLVVHHSMYTWKVLQGLDDDKLITVCEKCHSKIHKLQKDQKLVIAKATKIVIGK